jgi:hypothetical protein
MRKPRKSSGPRRIKEAAKRATKSGIKRKSSKRR